MRKTILKIYAVISVLLVADMVAYYFYKISGRGYYSDVMLCWSWFWGSIVVITLFWEKIGVKLLLAVNGQIASEWQKNSHLIQMAVL